MQLIDAVGGVCDLGVDERAELLDDRGAPIACPDAHELADLVQRATELLGAGDEAQSGDGVIVVHPIAGVGSARCREQTDVLVVAQRARVEPRACGDVGDAVADFHVATVSLRAGSKVKACSETERRS